MDNNNKLLKKQVIESFIENFFRIIPVNGKTPAIKNWQSVPGINYAEEIGENNYGIALDDDVLVIDVDPRNGGIESFEKLNMYLELDLLSMDTFIVKTGGGGYHIYLNKKPSFATKSRVSHYQGIDFKSKGGQVVGPYSIHPETKQPYLILKGSSDKLAIAPEKLLNLIARKQNHNNNQKTFEGMATKADIERYIGFLKIAEPAIEGDNGDLQTFKIACRGRDFGLSQEQNFECMLKHYNDRCLPSWDTQDLEQKVKNAYTYNEDSFGKRNPAAQFKDLLKSNNKEPQKDKINNIIKRGTSYFDGVSEMNYVIPELFPRGFISVLFGEPGCGKTWLCLALSIELLNSLPIWGKFDSNPAKLLFVEGDSPDELLKTRFDKLNAKLDSNNFSYVNRYSAEKEEITLNLSTNDGRANLKEIFKNVKPDIVIVDTLISFIDNENEQKDLKPVIDFLRQLADKYNCHILVCHHSRKRLAGESQKRKLDQSDVIGSSVITRLAGLILAIEKNSGSENKFSVSCKKNWFGLFKDFNFSLENYFEYGNEYLRLIYGESTNKSKLTLTKEGIVKILKEANGIGVSRKEIISGLTYLDVHESTIKNALLDLQCVETIKAEGETQNRRFYLNTDNQKPNSPNFTNNDREDLDDNI